MFGLLGPNGAGKTTTVEILEGYRGGAPGSSRCSATIRGSEPASCASGSASCCRAAACTGTSTSARRSCTGPASTRGRATRTRCCGSSASRSKAGARTRTLSGGQLRRLDLALALVGDPELIFLDEPTTGFDPAARRAAWETISRFSELGKTVLLTTHYLDEAQALCDRVAILKDGRILAEGPPRSLVPRHALPRQLARRERRAADRARRATRRRCFTSSRAPLSRAASRCATSPSRGRRSRTSTSS